MYIKNYLNVAVNGWIKELMVSLKEYADKPARAENKYHMSNVGINKSLLFSYLFTQNRREKS